MLRLLSWSGCDKIVTPDVRMFVPRQDSSPVAALQTQLPAKRKRSFDEHLSVGPENSDLFKTSRSSDGRSGWLQNSVATSASTTDAAEALPTPLHSPVDITMEDSSVSNGLSAPHAQSENRTRMLRHTIQSQISLEILLKHKELRLIDQELGKCQVALEQLRRCSEIPYPALQQPSQTVSDGRGSAVRSSFQTPLPLSPAPWGATDGPYSRHYAKWLLPDARFDGGEPDMHAAPVAGKTPTKGRSMRGSVGEVGQTANKSRAHRSGKLKALPAGYGQPREKASGPMIIKRKSDGVMVKLVCPDCGRHDFGSAQGFINHCRIGHSRSFASHDAAADACGEPVEYDESGAIIGVEPVTTPVNSNVHPLIRSARLLPSAPAFSDRILTRSAKPAPLMVAPTFRASSHTPHLSAFVKDRGLGLDLQDFVNEAKTKIELPMSDDEDDDDEMDVDTPVIESSGGRHPQVAGSKQPSKPAKSPTASPLLSSRMRFDTTDDISARPGVLGLRGGFHYQGGTDLVPTLEPSPTSESNQAPSLVDDDEEFEAHSPSSSSISDANEDNEVDFQVQDDEAPARDVMLSGADFQPSCTQSSTASAPAHVRRPSAIRRQTGGREEKHVSFVSPSPARDPEPKKEGGDKKRRKIL